MDAKVSLKSLRIIMLSKRGRSYPIVMVSSSWRRNFHCFWPQPQNASKVAGTYRSMTRRDALEQPLSRPTKKRKQHREPVHPLEHQCSKHHYHGLSRFFVWMKNSWHKATKALNPNISKNRASGFLCCPPGTFIVSQEKQPPHACMQHGEGGDQLEDSSSPATIGLG